MGPAQLQHLTPGLQGPGIAARAVVSAPRVVIHFNVARKKTQQAGPADGANSMPRCDGSSFAGSIVLALSMAASVRVQSPRLASDGLARGDCEGVHFVKPLKVVFLSTKPVDKNVDSLYKRALSHGSTTDFCRRSLFVLQKSHC